MNSAAIENGSDLLALRRFVRDGDESAFAELVDRHASAVFATCYRVLGHRALAEEATQEVFFRLARTGTGVQQSLAGWLHRVATRLAIDLRRTELRRRQRELAHEQARERVCEPSSWGEMAPHVDEAMESLDESDRRLLVEHFLERKPLRELAASWGTSPATLSRRLRGAIGRLRSQLQHKGVAFTLAGALALLRSNSAEAASPMLRTQLGKLSMVSAHVAPTPPAAAMISVPVSATVVLTGAALLTLGAACWLMVYGPSPQTSGPSTPIAAPLPSRLPTTEHQPTTQGPAGPAPYVLIESPDAHLDPSRITMIQAPDAAIHGRIAVVYGDGHVMQLTPAEADGQLRQQTGRSLDELARNQPRINTPQP